MEEREAMTRYFMRGETPPSKRERRETHHFLLAEKRKGKKKVEHNGSEKGKGKAL